MRMLITPPATARDITVTVSDGTDPISGASVVIGTDYSGTTGDDGKVSFEDVPLTETSITVTKSGFADYTGTISSGTVNITMTAIRNISFTIDDGNDPIEGASVVIGETTKTTGSAGGCTFNDITDGEHLVEISKEGYTTKTETITVSEDSTSFTISLEAIVVTRDISFTINDGTNAIEGASVVIGETTKTTDSSGECTFDDISEGENSVEVSATGYTTKTETISVDSEHTSFTVSLELQGNG